MRRIAVCVLVGAAVSVGGLIALGPGLEAAAPAVEESTATSPKGSSTADGAAKDHELIFMDGFESGDTSAWDYEPTTCTTVLAIPTNLKD